MTHYPPIWFEEDGFEDWNLIPMSFKYRGDTLDQPERWQAEQVPPDKDVSFLQTGLHPCRRPVLMLLNTTIVRIHGQGTFTP